MMGVRTNREAFWSYIDPCLPVSRKESEALADAFYDGEFNRAVSATQPTELSDAVVKLAKSKGMKVYLLPTGIPTLCNNESDSMGRTGCRRF